ncbi:hypothetical protein [Butyrivibrio sp. AE3009]|uniref:hypothetical protein n=1 Tax=Butyrivibrio sp. AE3009 TaxID=1280666 RepID=UPI0003B49548|nr:hypothetical protein [Butyrivibrio sp. AE3009]
MRTQRFLAVLLAATMVFGSTITAFAGDEAGTGSVAGTGASEGYVPATVVKVTVPTTSATTFAYTMDPLRLLATTNGARTGGWETIQNDTGVYFKTADGYANESDTVYFINKCSDKDIFVKVEAELPTKGTNDIDLATSSTVASADDANADLYLGLKVAGTTKVLAYGGSQAVEVKAAHPGTAQYEITYANKKYDKTEIAGSTFTAVPIQLAGAVSNVSENPKIKLPKEGATTAPKVTVKWSWKDAAWGSDQTTGTVSYVTRDCYTITGATASKAAGIVGGNPKANATITPTKGSTSIVLTFNTEVVGAEFGAEAIDNKNIKRSGNTITISNKKASSDAADGFWGSATDTLTVYFSDSDNDNLSDNPHIDFTPAATATN